ncbi:SusC/RagA family TonB-linked outer membrane protein [Chryseolinea lacunae]|uniref:TonB-dependent receptor n=1 Tax=Chryseolinea lacunae TaxID=2801331 RepID=A0ABS1KVN0_9BACT|nr:TonB-dependent receptor [Chryseolinea lacunae]MBL0743363.1 TonB-dependent receptor [Chryseolinea lacunae]
MRKILLFVFSCALFTSAWAQERTVSGRVTSVEDGSTLPGVNVVIKGTTIGTSTNGDGVYTLSVPEGSTLVFTFIGLETKEVEVGNRSVVDMALPMDISQLSEVVVVGYGTQSRKEISGSIASIDGSAVAAVPVQSFDQALQGRAAGVNVTTPNGVLNNAPVIRIRGVNSINLSSYPLVVIDGVPSFTVDNSANAATSTNSAANNPLGNLNPNDIESIEVLKDASASAIYGSRASAGVLLITTKRGSKGKSKINYDGWVGWSKPVRLFDLLNADQYMTIKNEARRNNKQADAFFPSNDANGNVIDTDWYKAVYQTGFSHSHNINFSGGTDATTFFTSVGYTAQEGMLKNNTFDRTVARVNLDHKVVEKLRIGTTFSYAKSVNSAPNTGSIPGQAFNTGGLGRLPLVTAPNVAAYLNDGTYSLDGANIGKMANTEQSGFYNPAVILNNDYFNSTGVQVQGSVYANWEVIKGLNLKTTYSISDFSVEDKGYQSPVSGDGFTAKGVVSNANRSNKRWNWANTAQYDFNIADAHYFSFLVGGEQQYTYINRWGAQRTTSSDIFFDTFQGNFANIVPNNNFQGENYLVSYFGRVNYDFKKKYFATFNFRRDGFSAFAAGKKYGNFYGGSVGYNVSEESFWKDASFSSVFNFFKLKGSYGSVGNNQGINDFVSLDLYNSVLYGTSYTIAYTQVAATNLSWETSKKTDLGFNFGLFQDRIQGEFVWYDNKVDGLILLVPQSPSKGIPSTIAAERNNLYANIGAMRNRGVEFSVKATALERGSFTWVVNANITTMNNKVLSLDSDKSRIISATSSLETANVTQVGLPIGSILAVPTEGVNPENGRRIFVKADGTRVQYDHSSPAASRWTKVSDGTPTSAPSQGTDGVVYGPTLPKWYGGLDNTFKYKNFDLGIFLQFSGGNYIYNGTKAGLRDMRFWNNSTDVLDRWTPEHTNGSIPRVVYTDNVSNGSSFPISENIEKGDFLRVRNLSLGYSLNSDLLSRLKMSNARIYAQVQNAFLITGYKGIDPEISANGNANTTPGIDRNSVGQARTYTVGINIGF